MNKTEREGNLPLPCSFMDIHICGACKAQFNNVELFIAHKQQSCPLLLEMRSVVFGQLGATNRDASQTVSSTLVTKTTNSVASSLSSNPSTTTVSNLPAARKIQTSVSHPEEEVKGNDTLHHHLHLPTNTDEGHNDSSDQSLSAKIELSFLDVQQVVREDLKSGNNFKDPFLMGPGSNCHSIIDQSRLQNATHTINQNILEVDDAQPEGPQISHTSKSNSISDLTNRPTQTMTPEQLIHTFQLTSSTNDQPVEQARQHADLTATAAIAQQLFSNQILSEPLDNLAAITTDTLQSDQQGQLTANFLLPINHHNQQNFSNESNNEIVSSSASSSSSSSIPVINTQSGDNVDSFHLRTMSGTDAMPAQVPAGGYMSIVHEFDVSSPPNSMLTECETLSASPTRQSLEPPPTTLQQSTLLPPTTLQQSTLLPPTTLQQSTLLPPTTLQQSTLLPPTTLQQSTLLPPTTPQQSTLLPPTTLQQSTLLPPTTLQQSTLLPPTTLQQSTLLPPTTLQQSTLLPPTTLQQSTLLPPTTLQQSTLLPPTTPQQSSLLPPTTPQQSSLLPPTTPQQSSLLTPPIQTNADVRNEVSNNLDNNPENTPTALLNETNQLQSVLPSSSFNPCVQTPTKQTNVSNSGKLSLKNRQTPNKKFKCTFEVCEFQTAYLKDLERHTRTHTGERPFQCQVCRKSFNRSDKLKIHQRGHTGNKPYRCQICSYSSADSSSLKKHLRIHTNERPFKCQMCSYASRNSSQLIVHLRTHTNDSPFQCQLCDATFKINSDLKRHVRTHTGEKPFKCDICDYRCSIKANLKSHYRINHSTENQLKCDSCDFTSSSRKAYKEHLKTHDADRPIKCHMCAYQCSRKSALLNHLRTHSEERPFRCDFCTYTSKQSSNVKSHMKKKHSDKLRPKKKTGCRRITEVAEKVTGAEAVTSSLAAPTTTLKSSNVDGGQVRMKLSCKKAYSCEQCNASFVRQDSLRSHVRQHKDIEKALQSTAMAVLQLQNPVGSANQQESGYNAPGAARKMQLQESQTPNGTSNGQCLSVAVPSVLTSEVDPKSASHPTPLFSSAAAAASSSTGKSKANKTRASFQPSVLNINNFNNNPQTSSGNSSLLSDLSSQKSILSNLNQALNIATLPLNNATCPLQSTENVQNIINIGQKNSNIVSMSTTDAKAMIISQNNIMNTPASNNLKTHTIDLSQQNLGHHLHITDSRTQTVPGFPVHTISTPLSTMATACQTNVSQVLPSSVTSPGVSTNSQSVVNGFLVNNQPHQSAIVTPQLLQPSTALQLISNVSVPFIRMPGTQLGAQTGHLLPNQVLAQQQEPISILSSSMGPPLTTHQTQQTSSEIPIQIISPQNQSQSSIPINLQISQINIDAATMGLRNEILEQCASNNMSASVQVILPPNLQAATTAMPQVRSLAPASTLDSVADAVSTSATGDILVQVSSGTPLSQSTSCIPLDQTNGSNTVSSTTSSLSSLPTNFIPVIEQTLLTTVDANSQCK